MGAACSSSDKVSNAVAAASSGSNESVQASNLAVVFIKPHANKPKVEELLKKHLLANNIYILSQASVPAAEIEENGIIDSHYGVIAANALHVRPDKLTVSDAAITSFQDMFGLTIADAAANGTLMNLAQYREKFPDQSDQVINEQWLKVKPVKLAPGTYAGKLENGSIVVNAFYGAMRKKYIAEGVVVRCFVVGFDENKVPWKTFRGEIIGATDPTKAIKGSLREKIYTEYHELGLDSQPNMSDNGVHASAGPIEGLVERKTWLGRKILEDTFAKRLLAAGVSGEFIQSMCANDTIVYDGNSDSAFDTFEDKDSSFVISAAKAITESM